MKKNPSRNENFKKETSSLLKKINKSIDIDQRLFNEDIACSIAHCYMMIKSKIISSSDGKTIIKGLQQIHKEIKNNKFKFEDSLEDIHMNIESLLFKKIGPIAGKLHTARSRNDQVATDLKLWIRKKISIIDNEIKNFQKTFITAAKKNVHTLMPGYTHLQIAQTVSFAHHMMAYVEMFGRDRSRLNNCLTRLNENPLGSGALAGTSFNINRKITTKLLLFKNATANSIDSVSDRDFVIEFIFCLSLISVHLSRLAEEIVLWSSQHFQFIKLPDELSTGSSILPQKKNPDGAELVRGKSSLIISNLSAILNIIKSMPLSYNKDMQEDKKLVFDSFDNVLISLKVLQETIKKMKINKIKMLNAINNSNATAIDLSDALVKELNYSFRDSYALTGKIVNYANKKNKFLHELSIRELKKFDNNLSKQIISILSPQNSIKNKKSVGGTAPENVKQAIKQAVSKYL